MNYERFGIYITIIVMIGVLGLAGVSSGATIGGISLGEPFDNKQILPLPEKLTDTSNDGFYDYCYRMGLKC